MLQEESFSLLRKHDSFVTISSIDWSRFIDKIDGENKRNEQTSGGEIASFFVFTKLRTIGNRKLHYSFNRPHRSFLQSIENKIKHSDRLRM